MEKKTKKLKKRSPNFPVISLKEAVEKAQILYDKDGQAGSTPSAVISHLGYKGAHGTSLGVISALKKFDLTTKEKGRIILTKDALFILLKGGNEEKRNAAIKRCALKPELYRKLWSEYSERGELPGDDTLKSQLVIDMGFNQKSVDNVIRAFRETLSYAGLEFGSGEEESLEGLADESGGEMTTVQPGQTLPKATGQVRDYSIPRRGQKLAVLRLEYPVTRDDIAQISNWLKLMEDTLSED